MRLVKWISAMTILTLLFAMLPATVAEDEITIDLGKSVDDTLGLELDEADMTAPLKISIEDNAFELNGLEGDLSDTENEDEIETPFVSNVNGDFEIDEEGTLTRYRGFEKHVVIPDGVKWIDERAFKDDTLLESVIIPNSVTYIGEDAFSGCTSLKSITIPDSVTELKWRAFEDCCNLEQVHLSNSLIKLCDRIFSGCSRLSQINIPKGIVNIGSSVFSGCDSLTSISIPDSVTGIDQYAFGYCSNLGSVFLPSTVSNIDRTAFEGSSNVVIRGTAGSYAERYANGMAIPFNAPIVAIEQETTIIYDDDDSYDALVLYINQSLTLTASQMPTDLTRTLTWSSSNTNIVTVDQNGTINSVSQGIATITVNTADGKGKADQIRVCVPEPTEIKIDEYWEEEDYKIVLGQIMTISADKKTPYAYVTEIEMPISWSSSDSSVISIEPTDDDKAILKGNQIGKATITASTPDRGNASFEMEVIRPNAESIKIDQSGPIKLYPGQKCTLTTTIKPADAGAKLKWYSNDKEIATVDQDGTITAVAPGATEIYLETYNDEYGSLDDNIEIKVLVPPKYIRLKKAKATLAVGDTLALKKTLTPEDAETNFTWISSKPSVATVSNKGKVTALKPGKAKITVKTDNGKKASAVITVKPAPKKVRLNVAKVTLGVKKKLTLKATLTPTGAYTALTWKSSKPAVASVSKKGVVTAKKPGTAVITVRTHNGKTAKVTIKVK